MSVAISTIIGDALSELNIYMPGKSVSANDAAYCLGKLNDLFDSWNAERAAVWTNIFTSFTLTADLSPHTIGPSGATWTIAVRPVTLDACNLILDTSTPDVFVEIDVHTDPQWWAAISVPDISTSIPTDVYYEKDFPLGKLYFWPVPDTAYGVELGTRTLLAQVTLTQSVDLPPGYKSALTYTLAEHIATGFGRGVPAKTEMLAREARARAFANNIIIPDVDLRDGQGPSGPGTFNYHSRSFR